MRAKSHLQLLVLSVIVWAAFWVIGLPDYYQQYSFTTQLILTLILIPPIPWIGWKTIPRVKRERRFSRAVWFSIYGTVPFIALDTWYCGVHLGHGASYVFRFWYLSVFYVLPWIFFIPIGWWWSQRD